MAKASAATHIALLRGMNLAGRNRLQMAQLIQLFEDAGCKRVRHYIQSGNIIFTAPPELAKRIPHEIAGRIETKFKLTVPVIVRTALELRRAIANNPFIKRGIDPSELHLVFLAEKPATKHITGLDPNRSPGDAFIMDGKHLYLHLPRGVARSKLTNAYIDSKLNTVSTSRNWRTALRLDELASS